MAGWRGRLTVLTMLIFATALGWPAGAMAAPPPCASILPLSSVEAGMLGTGWTVASGTTAESFDAEVLGVVPSLIAPGRDVIIAEISGPVVDGRGVWAGMSGSPVYDADGNLIGAVAYSFAYGPSMIAGLTPASDMARILTYAGRPLADRIASRVKLPLSMLKKISAATSTPLPKLGDTLTRLRTPVSVSGVSPERMGRVKKMLRRNNVRAIPYSGSAVGVSSVSSIDELNPGDNFAAAFSYGDLTIAGIGTTTYVCDGQALAFGHPFLLNGRTTLGASGANAIAIVTDPIFGAFKFANLEGVAGTVDQDRFAGIRAVDGAPSAIPITSGVTSIDTANARSGETDVVLESEFSYLAFIHLFSNIDTVFDEIGAGSSTVAWEIHGTRADGTPFEFTRMNLYTSEYDLSIESAIEMWIDLDLMQYNPFEKIHFTGVQATASVQDTVNEYTISALRVCRRGVCEETDRIPARPGQTIHLQAVLTPSDGSEDELVDLSLTVPSDARFGGLVTVEGAPEGLEFCLYDECGASNVDSFDKLLKSLKRQRANNVLMAKLRTGSRLKIQDKESAVFDRVVRGRQVICLSIGGGFCGNGGKF
jgi:hypothetical protein